MWSDNLIEDDGAPDVFNWNARQHEIADLPPETLPFLTASRYCESDMLSDRAWQLFGKSPAGWARVQEILGETAALSESVMKLTYAPPDANGSEALKNARAQSMTG